MAQWMLVSKRKGERLLFCWREKQGINKWLKKKSEEGPNARKLARVRRKKRHRKDALPAMSFCNGQGFEEIWTDSLPTRVLDKDHILCLEWMWKSAILIQTLTLLWHYAPISYLKTFPLQICRNKKWSQNENTEVLNQAPWIVPHTCSGTADPEGVVFFIVCFIQRKQKLLRWKRKKKNSILQYKLLMHRIWDDC